MKVNKILVIFILTLCWGCSQPASKERVEKTVPVRVSAVTYGPVAIPIQSTGIVSTSEQIKLSFKTGGILAETFANDGSQVKKGDLLARLNTTEISAMVNQAKLGYQKSLRDFNRAEALYLDSVATLELMQNAKTALEVSKSLLEAANFNLKHSEIRAPQDGIILMQVVRENELVAPGYPVFVLGIQDENWIIKTGVADRDMVKIHPGDSADVSIDAWPEDYFKARVSLVAEVADPQTGTYEIELQLDETDRHLATGFVAKLDIFSSKRDSFYLVPVEAVIDLNNHEGYVFVPNPQNRVQKIKVTVLTLLAGQAVITKGLDEIGQVVAQGSAYLKNGDLIEINR